MGAKDERDVSSPKTTETIGAEGEAVRIARSTLESLRPFAAAGIDMTVLDTIDELIRGALNREELDQMIQGLVRVTGQLEADLGTPGVANQPRLAPSKNLDKKAESRQSPLSPQGGGHRLPSEWGEEPTSKKQASRRGGDDPRLAEIQAAAEALSQIHLSKLHSVPRLIDTERCQALLRGVLEVPAVKASIDEATSGLGAAVRQLATEGFDSLTKDELRKLQTLAANRLKDDTLDQQVKSRAIAEDIFPLAKVLFPDRISVPADVDAETLTTLFREKAQDRTANAEPLSDVQLEAIKELSQAWRKHFGHVIYQGEKANITTAKDEWLQFRTVGQARRSFAKSKHWPRLKF